MTEAKIPTMIDFKPISPEDRALFESKLPDGCVRGCEFSFANLYLWGRQSFAVIGEQIALFSHFGTHTVYPFPIGEGDKKAALDAIIEDARARGIPCRITGLCESARQTLGTLYPDRFRFESNPDSFDYVYSIDDLAELRGKKYHGKRNHLNRFYESFPAVRVEPITQENLAAVREMADEWYSSRLAEDPEGDFEMEKRALGRAFRHFFELPLDGLVLFDGDRVLAFTVVSPMTCDTFDVHFEKALADIQGAYTAVNYEFARYIREKYPNIRFLDREEDMGIEGLRRAKQSYKPHHMIEKSRAFMLEAVDENK